MTTTYAHSLHADGWGRLPVPCANDTRPVSASCSCPNEHMIVARQAACYGAHYSFTFALWGNILSEFPPVSGKCRSSGNASTATASAVAPYAAHPVTLPPSHGASACGTGTALQAQDTIAAVSERGPALAIDRMPPTAPDPARALASADVHVYTVQVPGTSVPREVCACTAMGSQVESTRLATKRPM